MISIATLNQILTGLALAILAGAFVTDIVLSRRRKINDRIERRLQESLARRIEPRLRFPGRLPAQRAMAVDDSRIEKAQVIDLQEMGQLMRARDERIAS